MREAEGEVERERGAKRQKLLEMINTLIKLLFKERLIDGEERRRGIRKKRMRHKVVERLGGRM